MFKQIQRLSRNKKFSSSTFRLYNGRQVYHYTSSNHEHVNRNEFTNSNNEEYGKLFEACQLKGSRAINLLKRNTQCQLSTFVTSDPTSQNVKSSNVPYVMFPKNRREMYFPTQPPKQEKQQKSSLNPSSSDDFAGDFEPKDVPARELEHYEMLFCVMKDSPHAENLKHVPTLFNGTPDPKSGPLPDFFSTMVSMTFGLTDAELVNNFDAAGLLPPRAVLCADVELILEGSQAFSLLWKEYFRPHPHISYELKMDRVKMFRVSNVRSAYFVDLSMKMLPVESLDEFVKMKADDLSSARQLIHRLNTQKSLLEKLTSRIYNLRLGSMFAFDIDQCGIRILGKALTHSSNGTMVESDSWQEYYLDFGYSIQDEKKLQHFLMQAQSYL
jgi:hypothetical protein